MANSDEKRAAPAAGSAPAAAAAEPRRIQHSSASLARVRNGSRVAVREAAGSATARRIPLKETNALYRAERGRTNGRIAATVVVLLVLGFLSLGIMGAQGHDYVGSYEYALYSPAQVAYVLYLHAYNAIAEATHLFSPYGIEWLTNNVEGYWAIPERAQVIGITLICAVLLSVSGMLYQNVFRNPIAGPSMLGVSSGVSLGVLILVVLYGAQATAMLAQRYALCYGLGAAILIFVLVAGRKLSGKGRPMNTTSLMLIGSITSQLLGFVVSYVTLFVMDDSDYAVFYEVSQMLTVDTSALSWLCLGIASVCTIVPVYLLRYHMNALSFDEAEVRLWGLNYGRLRTIALVCGAIMILAAQIHTGMVGLVSLIVPYLARSWFGSEFSEQFVGSVCISTVLLLICRDITDLIPFVGDGLALGSVVSVVALPLFLVVVAKQQRGWE